MHWCFIGTSKLKGFEKKDNAKTKETGSFTTSEVIKLEGVRIPQFTTKRKIEFNFHVFKKGGEYNAILGRDFGQTLRTNVLDKSRTFEWDHVEIPMASRGHWTDDKIDEFHEECKTARRN